MSAAHNGGRFTGPCWHCKCEMWLPQELYDAAMRGREKITFFCAYGHPQVFAKGENDLDVMRRERDLARQQVAERDDHVKKLQRQAEEERLNGMALRKAAIKTKKRAAAGTCPCCKRTFRQMALHIRSKHPEFKAEAVKKRITEKLVDTGRAYGHVDEDDQKGA